MSRFQRNIEDPQECDLILLKDPSVYSVRWKLGRIKNLHPEAGNMMRFVTIRTKEHTFKRSIHQFRALSDDNNDIQ